jgi:hypothetical protein
MLKSKKGYFVGPQIRELMQDKKFEDQVSEMEKAAWKSFKNVTTFIYIKGRKLSCYDGSSCTILQSYEE